MKRLLSLVFVALSLTSIAQQSQTASTQNRVIRASKDKRITPAFFISGELNSADSFNRFLLMSVPELQFESFHSSDKKKWDFTYSGPKMKLLITYYLETEIKIEKLKNTTKKRVLSHVEFRSDFNTLARLYKRFTKSDETIEEIQGQLPMRGPVVYGYNDYVWNKNKYWFTLANFDTEGYCMLIRKI